VGARTDLKQMGYSEGKADTYAGILGVLTTGVSAFFPPARALILGAEALRLGVNEFYNKPMEKLAE
jgi:hypothetical protein